MGKNLIGAIDIGSSEIKTLVVERVGKEISFFWKGKEESEGIEKGVVVDYSRLAKVLRRISERFFEETKEKFPPAFVNIGGIHLSSFLSKGTISVSRPDQKISEEEVERVLNAAQTVQVGLNKEIIETLPLSFTLDGQEKIQRPIGLKGFRLEVEALLLIFSSHFLENLKKAFSGGEIEVLDFIPNPLAILKSAIKERERKIGVGVLNLGAETTEVSIFKDGNLIHFFVLPVGGVEITNKLAIFLKVDFESAEKIKKEYCGYTGKMKIEKIEIEGKTIKFNLGSISRIVREECGKIFERVKKEIKDFLKEKKIPAGIVLVGGGAKIPKIDELARKKFQLNSRIGFGEGISEMEKDPSFSLASGLVLAGLESLKENQRSFFSSIINFFKNFLP